MLNDQRQRVAIISKKYNIMMKEVSFTRDPISTNVFKINFSISTNNIRI